MKMRSSVLIVAAALASVLLSGCAGSRATTSLVLTTAQHTLANYSVEARGDVDGLLAANARWIAVDAEVDVALRFRGPRILGGPADVLWERTFEKGVGQRAYEIVFSGDPGQKWVQLVPVPWSRVWSEFPFLPPTKPGAAPLEAPGKKIPVERPIAGRDINAPPEWVPKGRSVAARESLR